MLATASVAYAREPLSETLWGEIIPLLQAHYEEVAHYKDLPLDPAVAIYERIESTGGLRIYTARACADASLIGYLVCFVAPSLHYSGSIFANQDILFVAKEHRGSRIGVDLIRHAHELLRAQDNVQVLFQHTKAKSSLNIGPMLTRLLGYELVDEIYAVRLDRG